MQRVTVRYPFIVIEGIFEQNGGGRIGYVTYNQMRLVIVEIRYSLIHAEMFVYPAKNSAQCTDVQMYRCIHV